MDIINDLTANRPMSSLKRPDIIEYQSDYIPKDIFVVYATDKDDDIPALLLQLWKFEGGYDHGIYNIVVNDFEINKAVPILTPKIHKSIIERIVSYRQKDSSLSEKEEFIMNLKPKSLSETSDENHSIPYECEIDINGSKHILNIPDWTPLQKLPNDRIKVGTIVEVWEVEEKLGIMKILKL